MENVGSRTTITKILPLM